MLTNQFDYDLPSEFIAQYPLKERSSSKLLCLDKNTGDIIHRHFFQILEHLSPKDLLVFNNTRVFPARLYASKISGGKIEILIERVLHTNSALAHVRSNKSLKLPIKVLLHDGTEACINKRCGDLFEIIFESEIPLIELLQKIGQIPLPKYIKRDPDETDDDRYQTVYATKSGAVAAPTAGLHFDAQLMSELQMRGINTAFVTLHVGAGTFKPVQTDYINQHKMHSEYIEVTKDVCELIKKTRQQKGRVIAVGTTSVRALESSTQNNGEIYPYQGETDIFIYPGYKFRCIDSLITNFHLPKSTLLMLVCALGGYENTIRAYETAKQNHYRFYSYGDAMWIF